MKGNIFDKHSRLKPRDGTIACAVARSEAVVRMTLFESISDFLGLSPRRERADRQDQRSPQRSSNLDLPRSTRRSLSPTPRGRTNRTKSRNTFSLSFEPEPEDISPPPRPEPANLVASHSQVRSLSGSFVMRVPAQYCTLNSCSNVYVCESAAYPPLSLQLSNKLFLLFLVCPHVRGVLIWWIIQF